MSFEERLNRTRRFLFTAAVAVVLAAIFFPMATFRLVDGDEGFSIMAAKLINQGQAPYVDFFYQQMFLHPYVYGAWLRVFGVSWYAARYLSACLAILLGTLLYCHAVRVSGRRAVGLLAAALYGFGSFATGWFTVVKTFALSTLLLFGAYAVISSGVRRRWRSVLSGFLFGLAVDVRLHFLGVLPAFVLETLASDEPPRTRWRQLTAFALGLLLAILPNLIFIARNPAAYVFDNLVYHSLRSSHGLVGDLGQKVLVGMQLVGLKGGDGAASIQMVILLLFSLGLAVLTIVRKERMPLSVWIALLLIILSFLPTPTFTQYFAATLPFMIVNAVLLFSRGGRWELAPAGGALHAPTTPGAGWRYRLKPALAVGCAIYVLVGPYDYYRYGSWARNVPGFVNRIWDVNWEIPVINRIAATIDEYAVPGHGTAISWWPGYFVQAKTKPYPRMENNWGRDVAHRVSQDQREEFHLISDGGVAEAIRQHAVPVAVLGNWSWSPVWQPGNSPHRATLLQNDYVLVTKIGDAEIYCWKAEQSGAGRRRILGELAGLLDSGQLHEYRTIIWPARDSPPPGIDARRHGELAHPVTDYSQLSDELYTRRHEFDYYLPALAGWIVRDDREHLRIFDFMADLQSFVAGDYQFTLLATTADRTGALYDIRRVAREDTER